MSGKSARRTGPALVAAALLFAVSCASIPPTNYYVLGLPREPGRSSGENKFPYSVSIEPFRSEPTYLRKKIIWRSESNRLGYYSYDRWAALPAEMFAFRLYERACGSNLFRSVSADGSREQTDLTLKGKIIAFGELDTAGGWYGIVEVKVELADRDGALIWSGIESHAEPAPEQSVEAVVGAIAGATEAVITSVLISVERSLEEMRRQEDLSRTMGAHYFPP